MSIIDKLNKLDSIKADIKSALVEKGQSPTDQFDTYGDNIRAIESGSGGDDGVFNWNYYNINPGSTINRVDVGTICINNNKLIKTVNLDGVYISSYRGTRENFFSQSLASYFPNGFDNINTSLISEDSYQYPHYKNDLSINLN